MRSPGFGGYQVQCDIGFHLLVSLLRLYLHFNTWGWFQEGFLGFRENGREMPT